MGAFVFDKCCFCIELKSGCFIIGYLSLVGYSILTVIGLLGIIGGAVITQNPELLKDEDDSFGSTVSPTDDDDDAQVVGIAVILLSAILLLIVAVMLTFVIVLLVGLHKNKPGHLKAYLIYSCIFIAISILGLIQSAFKKDGATIARSILNILWSSYTTLIIRSQYFDMRNPKQGPAIYNAV